MMQVAGDTGGGDDNRTLACMAKMKRRRTNMMGSGKGMQRAHK